MKFPLTLLLIFMLIGCSDGKAQPGDSYESYVSGIDRSCQSDSDCMVKDVGNCCGAYPQCTNKGAQVDKARVQSYCERKGMASICGFPSIESCLCQDQLCVNAGDAAGPVQ